MIDPGALGTLLIGLNAVRAEEHPRPAHRSVPAHRRTHGGIRVAIAHALRQAAAFLEPQAACEVAG